MAQITITEALSKLKLIKARIEKETNNAVFVTSIKKGTIPNGFNDISLFEAKAKSQYQSIKDLIEQRNKIKAGIVASNAVTKVTINQIEYTVAEAIERKNSIAFEKSLLNKMNSLYSNSLAMTEKQNMLAQSKLDGLLETSLGKDKSDPAAIKPISDNFWASNQWINVDPLGLAKQIEDLGNSIQGFLSEIDIRLTIVNSTSSIEI